MIGAYCSLYKSCKRCGQSKYYRQFPPRSGRKASGSSRKNICRKCERKKPAAPAPQAPLVPRAAKLLRQDRQGMIRMKGKSNNGRPWMQEIEWSLAVLLVEEQAAVVVTPYMIRRLYSNDDFRSMIMTRDHYTCRYCGGYGDTIDHIVPKSKGGHTTPVNCVCSCYACNQSKADQDAAGFMEKQRSPV
ncbi:HNH endonuclease [Paenibacillus elgii]|uniref:HNH endonuclease n=1 Tax=Paenibacillus elgii TaxID=189691 RepID=UPI000FD8A56B|nr:HNH endonuclease [Paenibacillus elgii]NEN82448.1 HNH endonuclease [Paenibacillus elgii]